jgi:ABC-type transporter Mla MlaB component
MELKSYRQWIGLLVVLVFPGILIAGLGWEVLRKQRDLDKQQVDKERSGIAIEIGADIRDRLNRVKAQEIAASGFDAVTYTDPSVALVASAKDGRLVLPWESEEPSPEPFRRAAEDLEKIKNDAWGVGCIDSTGLGTLVSGLASATSANAQLKLVNLDRRVHDVIRITHLHMVFEVFDDEAKAIRSFASHAGAAGW